MKSFSLGNRTQTQAACREAAENGLGHLFGDHSLPLHADVIERLPTLLRLYVECAEKLYGSIGSMSADLIKIHMQSSKFTLLRYDDFVDSLLPRLVERIKIYMAITIVEHFDYQDPDSRPCLVSTVAS